MNNLASGAIGAKMFVTNVGLITSNGPAGPNIMTAAWTHHISYEPALIMINLHVEDTTTENILSTGVFGVNIASDTQNVMTSTAGKYTGKDVDKIGLLKELGFEFYNGKYCNIPMVKNAALSAELRLIKHEPMGDHIIVIGEVIESLVNEDAKPLTYHSGKYWRLGENIPKPQQEVLDNIATLAGKYKKHGHPKVF